MRNFIRLAAFLAVTSCLVFAQEELPPSLDSGPLQFRSTPKNSDSPDAPQPDKNGVYPLSGGVVIPAVLHAMPAVASADDLPECTPDFVIVSAVIGTDGHAGVHDVFTPRSTVCTNLAIQAVKRSEYRPAKLDGRTVPVLACLRVPFDPDEPAVPAIQRCPTNSATVRRLREGDNSHRQLAKIQSKEEVDPSIDFGTVDRKAALATTDAFDSKREEALPSDIRPPVPIKTINAQYSPEARLKKIQGPVLLSLVVNENGTPESPRVIKSLGYGLDENAIDAAMQYRFHPATRAGKPVAVRITVDVNFKIVQ
jgi:TonB family protein